MTLKVLARSRNDKITLNENHYYVWKRDDGITFEYPYSVTKILNPAGVPDLPHIKVAADYGTCVHKIVECMLTGETLDTSETELCFLSAKILHDKLKDFIDNYRPANICRNPATSFEQTYFCEERFIAQWSKGEHSGEFGGSADVVVELSTPRGEKTIKIVFEFKTTSTQDRSHLLQTAVYMELAGADLGVVLYDNPAFTPLTIDTEEAKMYLNAFDARCIDMFAPTLAFETNNDEISNITLRLSELNKEIKNLTETRKILFDSLVNANEDMKNAIYNNNNVVVGSCTVKNTVRVTKSIDSELLKTKYRKVYDEVSKEFTTSYLTFRVKGGTNE